VTGGEEQKAGEDEAGEPHGAVPSVAARIMPRAPGG